MYANGADVVEVGCFKMVILLCPLDEAAAIPVAPYGERNRAIPTH